MFVVKLPMRTKRGAYLVTVPDLRLRWRERRRVKRVLAHGMREVEGTGNADKSRLSFGRYGSDAVRSTGLNGRDPQYHAIPANAAGVKSTIRQMRPQELERVAAVDEKIDALKKQIADLREERDAIVREAWSKGHAVRLADCKAIADREPLQP